MAESQRPRRRRLLSARGVEDVDLPALAGKGELVAAALADRERRHRTWLLRPAGGVAVLTRFLRCATGWPARCAQHLSRAARS